MDSINLKERRKSIRTMTINPECWLCDSSLKLIDISNTGAFIGSNETISPSDKQSVTHLEIKLPGELGLFIIPCEVVRIQWIETKTRPKGYAVKFGSSANDEKKVLEAWISFIRNNQIITVSQRIIDEYFGHGKRPTFT
jgi:hypothetical protein